MIYLFELKKVLFVPAIIGFAVLSVALNSIIIIANYNDYFVAIPSTDMSEMTDIFDDFDATKDIAERYIKRHALSGKYAQNVREKYNKLQSTISEKGANDDCLSLYFGNNTSYLHRFLFKTLFGAITAETCLLALFISLLSVGNENMRHTEDTIYATKTGRKIQYKKLLASLTAAITFFVLIFAITLVVFFVRFDWSSVWNHNVSSL
ncbi:hypothetical protein LQZ18_03685 [Lachnospiraceae bacterium ZAX-1]